MSRLEHWERSSEWPMAAAALAFLVAYAAPILVTDLSAPTRTAADIVTWTAWAVFALDYLVRLRLVDDRGRFVRTNLFDLAVVVLPLLRPLRLLRLVTLLSVLNRSTGSSLRGHVITYVGGATVLIILVAALAVLDAERRNPEANIVGFPDALWWAVTTVTTVGYGDRFPTTGTGRLIAVGLMIAGIALLGVVTASFASWLIDRVREVEIDAQAATRRDVAHVAAEIERLREELKEISHRPDHGRTGGPRANVE